MNANNLLPFPETNLFDLFWQAYPKKVAKFAAKRAFDKAIHLTTLDVMLTAIEAQKQSEQWQKGYIPHAATWIHRGQWLDETPPQSRQMPLGEKMILEKERERVEARINQLRANYGAMQAWTEKDKEEIRVRLARKKELLNLLGLSM